MTFEYPGQCPVACQSSVGSIPICRHELDAPSVAGVCDCTGARTSQKCRENGIPASCVARLLKGCTGGIDQRHKTHPPDLGIDTSWMPPSKSTQCPGLGPSKQHVHQRGRTSPPGSSPWSGTQSATVGRAGGSTTAGRSNIPALVAGRRPLWTGQMREGKKRKRWGPRRTSLPVRGTLGWRDKATAASDDARHEGGASETTDDGWEGG